MPHLISWYGYMMQDERSKDPDNELSDASVDKRIQRVVDELDVMLFSHTPFSYNYKTLFCSYTY